MASKAHILIDAPGMIIVRVDHLDGDSFSRSVCRAADKARKQAYYARSTTHVKYAFAVRRDPSVHACVSLAVYGTSFEKAQALLDSWAATGEGIQIEAAM